MTQTPTETDRCEVCGRTEGCEFEVCCSCWRGIPCSDRPTEYADADPLCCDYKDCGHTCTEDDLCSVCCGRGDCGHGDQQGVS